MTAGHHENHVLTESVISCTITGISRQMKITWSGFEDNENIEMFEPSSGTLESGKQTGTLKIAAEAVTRDRIYTCTVSSASFPASSSTKSIEVRLLTFGNFIILHFYDNFFAIKSTLAEEAGRIIIHDKELN